MSDKELDVVFMGGKQAGCIGLLSLISSNCNILGVIAYDKFVREVGKKLNLKLYESVKNEEVEGLLKKSDLLVCTHGREIVPKELLELPKLGGINVHPCLSKYKGKNPIGRMLENGETEASVGVHFMEEDVDQGKIILENFIDVGKKNRVVEVYNELYPYYATTIMEAVKILRKEL